MVKLCLTAKSAYFKLHSTSLILGVNMGVADKVAVALKALGKERGLPNKFLCAAVAERAGILPVHVPVALRSLKTIRVGSKDWSICVRRINGRSWVKVQ